MTRHHLCGLVFALAAIGVAASPAQAAKGVKKNSETVRGQVVGMHADKAGVAMTLKAHHHKKTVVTMARAAGVHHAHHTFQLTTATRVERATGFNRRPANLASIHVGSHVLVHAKAHQAETVVILGHTGPSVGAVAILGKQQPAAKNAPNNNAAAKKNIAKVRKA